MSAPSTAQFFKVRPDGERQHLGDMFCNCGWVYNEASFLSDIAHGVETSKIINGTMEKGTDWDYFVAYGMAFSKKKVLSFLK